jgi:thiol:disulfide interchange protein/DsbC/DsbD-like thiol-disulfide interchange protein
MLFSSPDNRPSMKPLLTTICLLAALAFAPPAGAQVGQRATDLVKADLLAEPAAIQPGEPFSVGLRLRMKPGWHTYWQNPGDSGLPTEIRWSLPEGFTAGDIQWPVPQRIPIGSLVNYGYEGEVTLLVQITPPADLQPGQSVALRADVNYLVCERECIPGDAKVATSLRAAGPMNGRPAAGRPEFAAARARLPLPAPFTPHIEAHGNGLVFRAEAKGFNAGAVGSAYFFPFDETVIQHAAEQRLEKSADGLTLTLTRALGGTGPVNEISGVLVLEEAGGRSPTAFEIGRPPVRVPTGSLSEAAAPVSQPVSLPEVVSAALLAFLGGLLLNLMPCVFPVLSIKLLALVRQAGHSPRAVRLNGLVYAAGVVLTFVALAAILLGIRAGGAEIGWGFQLQSPLVVASLAALLFAMGLSLSGVVAFGAGLGGVGGGLASRAGLSGSFATGVLATVVATPCTAPFMGAAIGFAVTASAPVAVVIFIALGLGMAAPFLALTFAPGLIRLLPRPGPWMETLKQVLAFPLYATVAWLVFVLAQEVSPSGLFAVLIGLVLVAFSLWAWGLAAMREGWARRVPQATALVALAAVVAIGIGIHRDPGAPASENGGLGGAEPFTQARLDAFQAEGRPVFVNLTAAWCITCLVNERTTLASSAVQDAMKARRMVYLKGDWTNRNPEITRLLARNGRSGVPLYLLYPGRGEPIVLPQILTEASLLESFGAVAGFHRQAEAGG